MATDTASRITARLAEFFHNGVPQVGLEVGSDAGLSPDEFIQLPKSMVKPWAFRVAEPGAHPRDDKERTADLRGKKGWTVEDPDNAKHVLIKVNGKWYARPVGQKNGTGTEIDGLYVDPHTYDDLRRFVIANTTHIRDAKIDAQHHWWVHGVRFWATITGLVAGSKNKEFTIVDNPTADLDAANEYADRIMEFSGSALTAAAARAASWRKTNHATGGSTATGYPARWLSQQGWWQAGNETKDSKVRESRERITTAFYLATHAVAVHNVLANMAHEDEGHWAEIDPKFGCTFTWEVMQSTKLRMAPKTQVAGAAMVVDATVVIKMLIKSSYVLFLQNESQSRALAALHGRVEALGVRAAVYASWFLDGHPLGVTKEDFNQKDPSCADLIGELGAVAVKYFKDTTIGKSPALINAHKQLASEQASDLWAALAKKKTAAAPDVVLSVYGKITGSAAPVDLSALDSTDEPSVKDAVRDFNTKTKAIAEAFGIQNPPEIKAEDLLAASQPSSSGDGA